MYHPPLPGHNRPNIAVQRFSCPHFLFARWPRGDLARANMRTGFCPSCMRTSVHGASCAGPGSWKCNAIRGTISGAASKCLLQVVPSIKNATDMSSHALSQSDLPALVIGRGPEALLVRDEVRRVRNLSRVREDACRRPSHRFRQGKRLSKCLSALN